MHCATAWPIAEIATPISHWLIEMPPALEEFSHKRMSTLCCRRTRACRRSEGKAGARFQWEAG